MVDFDLFVRIDFMGSKIPRKCSRPSAGYTLDMLPMQSMTHVSIFCGLSTPES
jgi:hypothetical protein